MVVPMTASSRAVFSVVITGVLVAAGLAVAPSGASPVVLVAGPPGLVTASPPEALRLLGDWDRRRAQAWAVGDVSALRRLYAPGSVAGRRDARMLGEYAARGLRVRGLVTQVLAWDVVRGSPGRLRLTVTDRMVAARVVGATWSVELPADAASRREVVLVHQPGGWVVAEVRSRGRPG